ncbi:MAG: DUF4381 domain-containing protein [Verrucomicrobiota bacterium]
MMPTQPSAPPAPIHDIAGPVAFFPYPVWVVILAAFGVLAVIGLFVWLTRRKRTARPLTPRQRALAAIEELRRQGAEAEPYAFGVRVSDALRAYIRDQYGLDAVTRTSVEFLEALRNNPAFTANEKGALSGFLESVDLLKYARLSAGADEIKALLDLAERLVHGEKPAVPSKAK